MSIKARIVLLTKGHIAVVSQEDYRRVNRHSWRVHFSAGSKRKCGKPYARATIKGKDVYLHRFIMNAPEGMHVDHLNHCTLDNRRENLEIVDHLENNKRRRVRRKVGQ